MTEQEAIDRIKYRISTASEIVGTGENGNAFEDLDMAIKALEEIQQYRAIGTPEECRDAVEKHKAKKPCKENAIWHCPTCGEEIYWDTDYGQQKFRYCPDCGQKLNWSDES